MSSKKIPKLAGFIIKVLLIVGIVGSVFIELPIFQKSIAITIDGVDEEIKVNGLYASDVINVLDNKLGTGNYKLNDDMHLMTFISDMNKIGIQTKKTVKMKLVSGEEEVTTFVATVKELLLERNVDYNLENEAILAQSLTSKLVLEERIVEEGFPVEIVENPDLAKGTENILQEGRNKQISELYAITQDATEKVGFLVVDEGATQIIEQGTKSIAPAVPTDSIWDQLAFCESGGRWDINTGNGYYGGLQFSAPTWNTASKAVGLDIPYAHLATREEQIMAATWLQAKSGWGQWPACSRKLGLIA